MIRSFEHLGRVENEHSIIVESEINFFNASRGTMPLKFRRHNANLLVSKSADAVQFVELHQMRQQINSLPASLQEDNRCRYLFEQDAKKRKQQEFQCLMMGKLDKLLKKRLEEAGIDYRKFRVGGHERGTYGDENQSRCYLTN